MNRKKIISERTENHTTTRSLELKYTIPLFSYRAREWLQAQLYRTRRMCTTQRNSRYIDAHIQLCAAKTTSTKSKYIRSNTHMRYIRAYTINLYWTRMCASTMFVLERTLQRGVQCVSSMSLYDIYDAAYSVEKRFRGANRWSTVVADELAVGEET